jgi:hypothetical protein
LEGARDSVKDADGESTDGEREIDRLGVIDRVEKGSRIDFGTLDGVTEREPDSRKGDRFGVTGTFNMGLFCRGELC